MRKLKKILVVIEPKQMRQVALERAMAISQASGKGTRKIIAVMPVTDFSWDLTSMLSVEQKDDMRDSVIAKHKKWLTAYLAIHAMGFNVEPRVIWSKTIGKDITKMAHQESVDLIIKTHEVHGMFDSVLFTPLDWQLLRHAPVPVLIAKDHIWHPTGKIAIALNVSGTEDHESRMLNMRLLREAQELSHIMHCEIHILNAIPPVMPPATIDLPSFTPSMMGDAALKEGCRAVLSFAARHRIPADCCHIREGHPDDVIPALCEELKPTALFIGTAARKGVAVALIGNICERVVDHLACDVAVITPKAVIERVPLATEAPIVSDPSQLIACSVITNSQSAANDQANDQASDKDSSEQVNNKASANAVTDSSSTAPNAAANANTKAAQSSSGSEDATNAAQASSVSDVSLAGTQEVASANASNVSNASDTEANTKTTTETEAK